MARMPAPNMFDTAVQTNKTSHIKRENKRNVLSCLIECLMVFKFQQTRPNTIKQGGQRNAMLNEHKDGGLKMLNIQSFNCALKLKWVKKYLDDSNQAKWKLFFDLLLNNMTVNYF